MSGSKTTKKKRVSKRAKVIRRPVKKPKADPKPKTQAEPAPHGGTRTGAGRPPVLQDAVRRNITFERDQLGKLDQLAEKKGFRGYSDAVRWLIDRYVK